jgi:hypothetical protein
MQTRTSLISNLAPICCRGHFCHAPNKKSPASPTRAELLNDNGRFPQIRCLSKRTNVAFGNWFRVQARY